MKLVKELDELVKKTEKVSLPQSPNNTPVPNENGL